MIFAIYTGVTQTVIHNEELLKNVNRETVISLKGVVEKRDPDTVNEKIATGIVELVVSELVVLGKSKIMLPLMSAVPEILRMNYALSIVILIFGIRRIMTTL